VVFLFLTTTTCLVLLRRRCADSARAAGLDRGLGVGALLVWLGYKIFVLLPGVRALEYSLPLQMCDITGLIAPLALLTDRRAFRAILYFWGIGLSSLAFVVPDLHEGIASGRFWLFWLSHCAIVGAALYDVAARQFRPRLRDYRIAVAAAAGYLALVLPFDVVSHFDYGYVGPPGPGQPPILDALGHWPWRVALQAVLVALELALLLLPWELWRRLSRARLRGRSSNVVSPIADRRGEVG
jgi:hypothetical integral membrane protein (TIGR02206 family)